MGAALDYPGEWTDITGQRDPDTNTLNIGAWLGLVDQATATAIAADPKYWVVAAYKVDDLDPPVPLRDPDTVPDSTEKTNLQNKLLAIGAPAGKVTQLLSGTRTRRQIATLIIQYAGTITK